MSGYYVEIATPARVIHAERIEKRSDLAARRYFFRCFRAWMRTEGPVIGELYRWDAEANARAGVPLVRKQVGEW